MTSRGRRLYHYTARHHADDILKHGGITRGAVPIPAADGETIDSFAPGWQWLTSDDSWQQSWATNIMIGCDRTECRFVVEIPLLQLEWLRPWTLAAADFGYTHETAERIAQLGGGSGDTSSWYIFGGPIPRSWLVELEKRPRPSAREARTS
jgi:hypothetical protein